MQERLHDSRAGELTHSLQPILPQTLVTKVPLGTAATFGKVGAKTYTEAEGSKKKQVLPAPALDTVSTTRRA